MRDAAQEEVMRPEVASMISSGWLLPFDQCAWLCKNLDRSEGGAGLWSPVFSPQLLINLEIASSSKLRTLKTETVSRLIQRKDRASSEESLGTCPALPPLRSLVRASIPPILVLAPLWACFSLRFLSSQWAREPLSCKFLSTHNFASL